MSRETQADVFVRMLREFRDEERVREKVRMRKEMNAHVERLVHEILVSSADARRNALELRRQRAIGRTSVTADRPE